MGALTATLAVVTVAVLPSERRARLMTWVAWIVSAVATVRGAFALGLSQDDAQVALFAWGAVVTSIAFGLDRRGPGDRSRWIVVRDGRQLMPLAAGALALGVAMRQAWESGPGSFGWWTLALGVVVATWAVLADAPWLTVVAFALGADAAARLLPWPLPDQAWNLAVAVVVTTLAAAALRRWTRPRPTEGFPWDVGWATWPFVVANGAAAVMVALAEGTTTPALTYLAVAVWAFAVAGTTRWWPWAAAGAVLFDVGAGRAGPGWLALALTATAIAATVAAARTRPPVRTGLQVTGAATLAGAWVSAAWWADVGLTTAIIAGSATAGVVAVGAAVVIRRFPAGTEWALAWGGTAVASVIAAGAVAGELGERPSAIGIGIGVLLVALATGLVATPFSRDWLRDAAAGLAAGGGALVCVGAAATPTTATVTAFAVAAAALAISVGLHRGGVDRVWSRPGLDLAALGVAAGLAVVALTHPVDPVPLTVGLLLAAAVAAVAAPRVPEPGRFLLRLASAAAVAGAWAAGAWALGVDVTAGLAAGAVTAGAVTLLAALLLRSGRVDTDWLAAWATVGTLCTLGTAAIAPSAAEPGALIGVGAGIVLLGVASAAAARPLGQPMLRDTGALVAAAGAADGAAGFEATAATAVAVACTVGLAAVAIAALLAYRRPDTVWLRPTIGLAVVATVGGVAVAATVLPDRSLLVPALTVAGAYAAVLGVTTRRAALTVVAPVLLCAAWLTSATEALTGNPEWVTVPIGVTILVVEGLLRATLRGRGEPAVRPEIVAVDYVGMTFVVGATLVQTVAVSLWYGLLAVALGGLLAVWGAITRVRRRALFGVAVVALAVVLLVGLPLSDVALQQGEEGVAGGSGLWLVLAGIGLVAIMIAAFLEQGRRRVRAAVARIADLTRDWSDLIAPGPRGGTGGRNRPTNGVMVHHDDPLGAPLAGIRVLDCSQVVAGPLCGRMLADMGADVIKVEFPALDRTREVMPAVDGQSLYFTHLNAGKRGVGVDLTTDAGVQLIGRLAERVDALIENFRPGVLARRGLGADALLARNPRLVYCSISGWGQDGPWSDRQSYAPLVHAEAGRIELAARLRDAPPQQEVHQHGDVNTALVATGAILAALLQAARTGRGQHLDLALAEALVFTDEWSSTDLHGYGRDRFFDTWTHPVFTLGDGSMAALVGNPVRGFDTWLAALGRPPQDRPADDAEALAVIRDAVAAVPDFATLERLLAPYPMFVSPVRSVAELADTEWADARDVFREVAPGARVVRAAYRSRQADVGVRGTRPASRRAHACRPRRAARTRRLRDRRPRRRGRGVLVRGDQPGVHREEAHAGDDREGVPPLVVAPPLGHPTRPLRGEHDRAHGVEEPARERQQDRLGRSRSCGAAIAAIHPSAM